MSDPCEWGATINPSEPKRKKPKSRRKRRETAKKVYFATIHDPKDISKTYHIPGSGHCLQIGLAAWLWTTKAAAVKAAKYAREIDMCPEAFVMKVTMEVVGRSWRKGRQVRRQCHEKS